MSKTTLVLIAMLFGGSTSACSALVESQLPRVEDIFFRCDADTPCDPDLAQRCDLAIGYCCRIGGDARCDEVRARKILDMSVDMPIDMAPPRG